MRDLNWLQLTLLIQHKGGLCKTDSLVKISLETLDLIEYACIYDIPAALIAVDFS